MIEMKLKGPEGVRARIEELRARMREVYPDQGSDRAPGTRMPSPLSGSIGGDNSSVRPFDPTAQGVRLSPEMATLMPLIEDAANQNNIDPALLHSIVQAESGYDVNARSRAGALGLTQLMPATAASLGVTNPFDAAQNLNGGAKYLNQLMGRFNGDLSLVLAAYNAGPGAVQKYGGVPPYNETRAYVQKVLDLYNQRRPNR